MSQKQTVLVALMRGERITAKQAMDRFGILRLAARIDDLKREGWDIESELITVRNRHGEECRVAEYRMKLPDQLELDLYDR